MAAFSPSRQHGVTLIEVLVTLVLLLVGLLGLAALQNRAHMLETESYQREQALVLLRDIATRISANRANAVNYVTAAALGTSSTIDCSAPATMADTDLCQWDQDLKGAAETLGTARVGAMIGARGCVSSPATDQYLIQVVWQGLVATSAPPASVTCGAGLYGTDSFRRAVTSVVQIGVLSP
ncbi:MAG: type IV pilus modification protein PilV [Rhodocyclaceae bacterium]|nr:type IV pilus modification protein PilV [Rhodocyclaceae bacterium]MBX3667507.1 type IV pilus modification protein PilV [Rhodocyclaceae bacterium]